MLLPPFGGRPSCTVFIEGIEKATVEIHCVRHCADAAMNASIVHDLGSFPHCPRTTDIRIGYRFSVVFGVLNRRYHNYLFLNSRVETYLQRPFSPLPRGDSIRKKRSKRWSKQQSLIGRSEFASPTKMVRRYTSVRIFFALSIVKH